LRRSLESVVYFVEKQNDDKKDYLIRPDERVLEDLQEGD
jgi:hypothetical protein